MFTFQFLNDRIDQNKNRVSAGLPVLGWIFKPMTVTYLPKCKLSVLFSQRNGDNRPSKAKQMAKCYYNYLLDMRIMLPVKCQKYYSQRGIFSKK